MKRESLWCDPVLVAAVQVLVLTAALHGQEAGYDVVAVWGRHGAADGEFRHPVSIAVGPQHCVYVVDQGNARIQKFASDGRFLAKWGAPDKSRGGYGGSGNTAGKLRAPRGIAVDAAGRVYVVEWGNHRVQRFTSNGEFVAKWEGRGSEDGLLNFPTGVAAAPNGDVYVADQGNARLQAYSAAGRYLRKIARYGCRPCDVVVAAAGSIHIVESRGRFWTFDPDGSVVGWRGKGHRVESPDVKQTGWFDADQTYSVTTGTGFWAEPGNRPGEFDGAQGIGVDSHGNVYVADSGNHRIQKFGAQGKLLSVWGAKGGKPGQFNWPYDVAVDADGSVYVADKYNHRVQKFARVRDDK